MAVTGTTTYRTLIQDALLDIEAATLGQTPTAAEAELCLRHLNRLVKSWQLEEGPLDFLVTSQSVTATTGTNVTLSPVRPLRILNARLKQSSGIEIPMFRMTRQEYDELPQKTSTGTPTNFYYDRQKESALFYVWPVFASVTTETYEITYEREWEDITNLDATADFPAEWWNALVLNIGARVAHTFGSAERRPTIRAEAYDALQRALGGSVTESVYFMAGRNG
jgi:hypothetical protein